MVLGLDCCSIARACKGPWESKGPQEDSFALGGALMRGLGTG